MPPKFPAGAPKIVDDHVIDNNPYLHFMISEGWAGAAGAAVYVSFHVASWFIEWISGAMPLHDKTPAAFLELVLSWGGSISAAATFVIVSAYQLFALLRRVVRSMKQ